MAVDGAGPFLSDYPISLKLSGRRCLMVGGGRVAERKVAALLEAGAEVRIISPDVTPQLAQWAAEGLLQLETKKFYPHAVAGCFLVFCATDSERVNRRAAAAAKDSGALVNVADSPELCDFTLPAKLTRGSFSIAVSTAGQSPALARRLRDELGEQIGPEYGEYLDIVGQIRREWQDSCADSEKRCRRWRDIGGFDAEALELLRSGRKTDAEVRIRHVVGSFGAQS